MTSIIRAQLEKGVTDKWAIEAEVRKVFPRSSPITHVYGVCKQWQREQAAKSGA